MDKEYSNNVEELSEDEAWIVLYLFLIQGAAKRASDSWEELENNIKNHNRFFPQSSLIDTIKALQDIAILDIGEDS